MGVKSLWTLLTPVGRPVMLETVEGKILAIDSSIWIYQFQATMRDKEGRALANAHVLGFLRRLSKLLFHGIKPVFVFDGGAPALKRNTINERRKKKAGAATSHVKLAEKILAAQLRKEALNHATASSSHSAKPKSSRTKVVLDENTVYVEDGYPSPSKTPAKKAGASSPKKNKYHDHDPYHLPEVDLEEAVANATRTTVPDPRLATEEELRLFIEEMRPEDFDVTSPAFKELPTEIQYEIVGDLRLKSRQTSYARLEKMLQTSHTPLDFSKQQIQNLRQRNTLTQQLLATTDSIGGAHIAIPVRIASERNREYVLMKNEGESGGWILGIRDIGTREKPIILDHEEDKAKDEDSDAEMEEVEVPTATLADSDLREYQRDMALSAIGSRSQKNRPTVIDKPINRRTKSNMLFNTLQGDMSDSEDDTIAYAIQRSLDDSGPKDPRLLHHAQHSSSVASSSKIIHVEEDEDIESMYAEEPFIPTRLETALSIAGTGPGRLHSSPVKAGNVSSLFGKPTLLASPAKQKINLAPKHTDRPSVFGKPSLLTAVAAEEDISRSTQADSLRDISLASEIIPDVTGPSEAEIATPVEEEQLETEEVPHTLEEVGSDSDIEMEEVVVKSNEERLHSRGIDEPVHIEEPLISTQILPIQSEPSTVPASQPLFISDPPTIDLDEKDDLIAWSRSPSPTTAHLESKPTFSTQNADWDAAHEMDIHAEEGEFAQFMSQVKGKNLDDVRKEIDEEITHLNEQRRAAMRDSEDITQQMIAQIMSLLRLFGIPYITAPMEAEAQCAELLSLNLVDGVITDDSDVFLFGAQRVYKNMFNQSKTVECFLLNDLSRELGLTRDTLIQLAYLLGSDYTEGLPGIGPVVAMELLKEFPGRSGLHNFKDWWTKVQSGKDREEDNKSKFRKQFKKKFKNLFLPVDWPNSVVRDAYYHPTVDSSEEPFKWGMPDLDGLRSFLHQELGWRKDKVDDLLLPIIQKMNKRNQEFALNKQGNLNDFLDLSAGSGTHAPRQRQAYASKRLQQVISDFRKRQRSDSPSASRAPSEAPSHEDKDGADERDEDTSSKKRKRTGPVSGSRGRGARRRGGTSTANRQKRVAKGKSRAEPSDEGQEDDDNEFTLDTGANLGEPTVERDLRPRPKPRPIPKKATEGSPRETEAPV